MVTVARLYRFRASHYLPGVKGYDQPHEHDYTIEVAVSDINVWQRGMVVDTAAIDAIMEPLVEGWVGADLNAVGHNSGFEGHVGAETTVENLSKSIRVRFTGWGEFAAIQVTVWEDDDRWGRA